MNQKLFPVIDPVATGKNIMRLREERGMTVRDLQAYFGFEDPQAIYKWQRGKTLPSVDNLYALGSLLNVHMDDILVPQQAKMNIIKLEQQDGPCCSNHFWKSAARGATGISKYINHFVKRGFHASFQRNQLSNVASSICLMAQF